jgi:hypothetical protein
MLPNMPPTKPPARPRKKGLPPGWDKGPGVVGDMGRWTWEVPEGAVLGAEKLRLPRKPPDLPPPARAQTSLETKAKVKTRMIPRPRNFIKNLLFFMQHLIVYGLNSIYRLL